MWSSGTEIYTSFLDGIRRTSQTVVKQDKFVRLWNEWALPEWMKINTSIAEGVELTQKQIDDLQTLIEYEDVNPTATNIFDLPTTYKRMLRVWFRLSATGDWIKSYPLRSIDESFVLNSKYSAPSTTLLYHRTYANKVEAVTPTGYAASTMQIMYIRYPNEMSYAGGTIVYVIDLGQEQLEEIRDIAVRLYLERVKDPRWQSFLQEEMLKNIIQK
jgi:hypothetical protein